MTQPPPPNPAQPIKFTSRVRRGLADVRALVLASFDPSAPPSTAQTTKWSADRRRYEYDLWREAGHEAKSLGLYSPKTYIGDVATAMRSSSGVRGGMVKPLPEGGAS